MAGTTACYGQREETLVFCPLKSITLKKNKTKQRKPKKNNSNNCVVTLIIFLVLCTSCACSPNRNKIFILARRISLIKKFKHKSFQV